jgi:hypothetical protein
MISARRGINRGIIETHQKGVLTSTSLMVTGRVGRSDRTQQTKPDLAIGPHWDVWGEDARIRRRISSTATTNSFGSSTNFTA